MAEQHREVVEQQGVEAVLLEIGEGHVELLKPLGPETGAGKVLALRGPGLGGLRGPLEGRVRIARVAGPARRLLSWTARSTSSSEPRATAPRRRSPFAASRSWASTV